MSSSIETLNHWGDQVLNFAWPMFWQSSLLIALVFALDLLLARKIRAAVRYALWLAVLVKLLLPPALALPTGAAWWLFPVHQTPVASAPKYTVTYDQAPMEMEVLPATIPRKLAPTLNQCGWMLLTSVAASAGFLAWLGVRWKQVGRLVREAIDTDQFTVLVDEARSLAGLRHPVPLKLVEGRMSPAVCGLFHPVILLPRALAEKLSPAQLRAVLLHEMVHLRRGDVWVNCAQALLQIAYWWHPLLWGANARIRRVREEAVDDAVMLALREEAEGYAATLLEVAKLALRRPLVSLGLVGIMESRSALRQRIERLMDFRAPRKAGLTFASFCGIFVFSAVALPMGQAPVADSEADLPQMGVASPAALQSLTLKVDPEIFLRNEAKLGSNSLIATAGGYPDRMPYGLADVLHSVGIDCIPPSGVRFNVKTGEITIQNTPEQLDIFRQVIGQLNRPDGIFDSRAITFHRKGVLIEARFFWMPSAELDKLTPNLKFHPGQDGLSYDWTFAAGQFNDLDQRIKSLGLTPFMRPRVLTAHGTQAQFFCGSTYQGTNVINGVEFDCCPLVIPGGIQLAFKTDVTGLPAGSGQGLAGTTRFSLRGMDVTEDHGGMILRADDPNGSSSNLVMVLSLQVVTNESHYAQRLEPISKSIGSNTAANSNSPALALIQAGQDVEWAGNPAVLNIKTREGNAVRGIRLVTHPIAGKELVTTAETGEVKAGLDDDSVWLTLYDATIDGGNVLSHVKKYKTLLTGHARPQVHIKARFIEVSKGTMVDLNEILAMTNSIGGKQEGVLDAVNARNALRSLESQRGFEVLAEPEVTVLSGRQTQMRATSMITVVTNMAFQETGTNKSVVAQTGQIETGPIIDAVPRVMADGYTLNLKITASVIDFLGYDKSTNTSTFDRAGEKIELASVAPRFAVRSTSTTVNVLDDQTVVFTLGTSDDYSALARLVGIPDPKSMVAGLTSGGSGGATPKEPDKQILVFVTTTLVDSAGNRLHTTDELAALSGRVVPQPIQ
jgi:beta-lactamase regulating signal transducer with metallopeptidase domain